jgi:hypothetical protein
MNQTWKCKWALALVAGAFFSTALPARAGSVALEWATTTNEFTNAAWSLGFEFTANKNITVTSLGFFDQTGGISQSHDVGIYDLSGNLLTSNTVLTTDPLTGHFRYHATSPITLTAGTNYRIAAETGADNYSWDPDGFFTAPEVTYVSDVFTQSSTLVFPGDGGVVTHGFFGPNFQFNAVPEPAGLTLLGVGVAGLIGYGLRRRRQLKA